MVLIAVDGIIASGKSTILNLLKNMGYIIEQQPVHEWTLLAPFYEDPKKYAVPLQEQIINSYKRIWRRHCKHLDTNVRLVKMPEHVRHTEDDSMISRSARKVNNKDVVFLEACGLSSFNVFVKMLHDDKVLSDSDVEHLSKLAFDTYGVPDIFIYLDCEPEKSIKRIAIRGREGEKNIKLQYLQRLQMYYEDFMKRHKNMNIIRIDNNSDHQFKRIARQIDEMIGALADVNKEF